MKQIPMLTLASFLLMYALPVTATDGTTLPDYETSGERWYKVTCDNKTTKVTTYRSRKAGDYILEIATFSSRDAAYIMGPLLRGQGPFHFFWKDADSSVPPVELSKETWLKKIKTKSKNYYTVNVASFADMPTSSHDCRVVQEKAV